MTAPRLLLASTSPRRRSLLAEANVRFDAVSPGIDDGELTPGTISPASWTTALAYMKACAAADAHPSDTRTNTTVLGADTVVVKHGAIIGQPKDEDDARRILHTLSAGQHRVLSGVALIDIDTNTRTLLCDAATVRLGALSETQIESYLATGTWRGKAGAYNLSERLANGWPLEFIGDPTTVMGLPMRMLASILKRFTNMPQGDVS